MKNVIKCAVLILAITLSSCRAKLPLIKEEVATTKNSTEQIINQIYANKNDFQTAYIKANIAYKDDKQSQNVTAEIKILKDQKILISVRVLGFTVAKGIITPAEVKYYEKVGGKYFEGNYATLSKWLGSDLDFFKVQNMLLGLPIDDLKLEKYVATIQDNLYKLENAKQNTTEKSFYFEAVSYLMKKQEITQTAKNRKLSITYADYRKTDLGALPPQINIIANNNNAISNIEIVYKSAIFNQELSFPYDVPSGYDQLIID